MKKHSRLSIKTIQLFLLATLFSLSLTHCGFQLRTQSRLPDQLRVLYIQSSNPYGILETQLRRTLASSGVRIVKNQNESPVTLGILGTTFNSTTASIGPSSQSRIYTFVYSVTFNLTGQKGNVIYGPQTVSTTNTLTLSADQLLQSNDQLELLKQNMVRDLITRIYNVLSSQSVKDKFATYHS